MRVCLGVILQGKKAKPARAGDFSLGMLQLYKDLRMSDIQDTIEKGDTSGDNSYQAFVQHEDGKKDLYTSVGPENPLLLAKFDQTQRQPAKNAVEVPIFRGNMYVMNRSCTPDHPISPY